MQFLKKLEDLRLWCANAKQGEQKTVFLEEKVTQDQANAFAAEVNAQRTGHIWININVVDAALSTQGLSVKIHLRCSY